MEKYCNNTQLRRCLTVQYFSLLLHIQQWTTLLHRSTFLHCCTFNNGQKYCTVKRCSIIMGVFLQVWFTSISNNDLYNVFQFDFAGSWCLNCGRKGRDCSVIRIFCRHLQLSSKNVSCLTSSTPWYLKYFDMAQYFLSPLSFIPPS